MRTEEVTETGLMQRIALLYKGREDTLIASCLQGIMGRAWAVFEEDGQESKAVSALISVGDFLFPAGRPQKELTERMKGCMKSGFALAVPKTAGWGELIEEQFPGRFLRQTRYAMGKKGDGFDTGRLKRFAGQLPAGFSLWPVNREWFERLKGEEWSKDFVSQFSDYGQYSRFGGGFLAVEEKTGEAVSGASSYTVYRGGLEIEVDTKESCRRLGLARACSARLILDCLKRGLYPSWDAANEVSLHLAETLGYRCLRPYPILYLTKEER